MGLFLFGLTLSVVELTLSVVVWFSNFMLCHRRREVGGGGMVAWGHYMHMRRGKLTSILKQIIPAKKLNLFLLIWNVKDHWNFKDHINTAKYCSINYYTLDKILRTPVVFARTPCSFNTAKKSIIIWISSSNFIPWIYFIALHGFWKQLLTNFLYINTSTVPQSLSGSS